MTEIVVFRTGDELLLAMAKELLEDQAVPFIVRGEGLQHLTGVGTIGTGFNLFAGASEILVRAEDSRKASDILSVLDAQ